MKKKRKSNIGKYALFFISVVFLIETAVFVYVLLQMQPVFLGPTYAIAWTYALIKFIAGLLALYASINAA